jgi:hypothetical protein
MYEENNYIKDAVKSVLRICSAHNKEGPADNTAEKRLRMRQPYL